MPPKDDEPPEPKRPPAWRITLVSLIAALATLALFFVPWWFVVLIGVFAGIRLGMQVEFFPELKLLTGWLTIIPPTTLLYFWAWALSIPQLGVVAGAAGVTAAAQLRPLSRQGRWVRWMTFGLSAGLAAGCGMTFWLR